MAEKTDKYSREAGPLASWLAEDLKKATEWWTVLRMEYDEDKRPLADRGFFIVGGEEGRFWMLSPTEVEGKEAFAITFGSKETLQSGLEELQATK